MTTFTQLLESANIVTLAMAGTMCAGMFTALTIGVVKAVKEAKGLRAAK